MTNKNILGLFESNQIEEKTGAFLPEDVRFCIETRYKFYS